MVQARSYEMTASHLGRSTTKAGKPFSATYITNQAKGTMGEIAGAQTLKRAGYTKLPSKLPGNQGIDGVFVKWENGAVKDIIVVESKYSARGVGRLARTEEGRQMSNQWIKAKVSQMQGSTNVRLRETGDLLFDYGDLIRRKVNVLDARGITRWNTVRIPIG